MKTDKIKLTKTAVERLPLASGPNERKDYYDSELPNFGVRVSGSSKKYFVMKYVGAKRVRVTLGDSRILTAEKAREKALITLGGMAEGVDPNEAAREQLRQEEAAKSKRKRQEAEEKALALTLQEVVDAYLGAIKLKPRTTTTYQALIRLYLQDWLAVSVTEITPDMIKARHAEIATGERGRPRFITVPKTPEEIEGERAALADRTRTRGQHINERTTLTKRIPDPEPKPREAAADNCMRTLGAVLEFYKEEKNPAYANPVRTLSGKSRRKTITGKWFKVDRRKTLIVSSDLPAWHKAVMALENDTMRDYLLFLMFTGLRRNEAARLVWKLVDFREQTFTVTDTKNGTPHTLPLSDYLFDLLQRRKGNAVNEYVFPGEGKTGYLQEPRKAINEVKDTTGIEFSCHDLRRTFATQAESLELSQYALKSLLNHKQDKRDVTNGYIDLNEDRLREPMQRITDKLLARIGTQHGQLIDFTTAKKKAA